MAQSPDPVRAGVAAPARASGNMICMASMVAWAAGFPAAEILLDKWDPLALITARFVLAVAMLVPVWLMLDGPRALLSARWGRGTLVGGLSFGIGAWLLLIGQSITDPVTVAIVASATPIGAALIEVLADGRRLGRWFTAGLIASVLGGIVASGSSTVTGADFGIGAGIVVISGLLFAWGSRAAVHEFPDLTPVGRTTITLAGGLAATSAILLVTQLTGIGTLPETSISGREFGLLAVYALGSMALSQLLWIMAVGRLGVAVASFHINVAPFYVMVIMLGLGAAWSWPQAIGAGIVALGVLIAGRD